MTTTAPASGSPSGEAPPAAPASGTPGTPGEGAGSPPAAGKPSAGGTGTTGSGDAAQGFWPTGWREQVAGEDQKLLERVGRYASPKDVFNALVAAQNKISSGELRPALGKNATAEEIAAYRKELGIPEKPGGYSLDLGAGFVVADDDKPLIDTFLQAAHSQNMTPAQTQGALRAYYEIQEQAEAERSRRDEESRTTAEDALRTEWGQDFRPNVNRVTQLLDRVLEPSVKDEFVNARLADGTPIFNHPGILKALVQLSLIQDPSGIVAPGGGGVNDLDGRIKEIESKMGTKAYQKDEKMQEEYRNLVDARERLGNRKAA